MPAQTNDPEAKPNLACDSAPDYDYDLFEHRSVSWLAMPFPATVRGVDQSGDRFRIDTVLDNFSAAGLYVRLARPIEPGATLFVVVRFTVAPVARPTAPGMAARGVVMWAEPRHGVWGIAVKFMRQRFLYAATNCSRPA
jgi:PilZ domain